MGPPAGRQPVVAWCSRGRLGAWAEALSPKCADWLREAARRAGATAGHEISLVLCESAFIRRLNHRWRGKDSATDVLSFPQQELRAGEAPAPGPLGDIVIAPAVALRGARELGAPIEAHLQLLVVHGLLHLLGHDHTTDREAKVMEGLEQQILAGGLDVSAPSHRAKKRKD